MKEWTDEELQQWADKFNAVDPTPDGTEDDIPEGTPLAEIQRGATIAVFVQRRQNGEND